MSEKKMQSPGETTGADFAELLISLPADWPIATPKMADPAWAWPLAQLRALAVAPWQSGSWFGARHIVANGVPPRPYATTTSLSGFLLLPPFQLFRGSSDWVIRDAEGENVSLYALYALYPSELLLANERGTNTLLDAMEAAGLSDILDQRRPEILHARRGRA